jgi:hypothetical protein
MLHLMMAVYGHLRASVLGQFFSSGWTELRTSSSIVAGAPAAAATEVDLGGSWTDQPELKPLT